MSDKMTAILSDRLLALLYESKRAYNKDISEIDIVKNALGHLYSHDMSIKVMCNHCLNACVEICQTTEFYNSNNAKFLDLLTKIITAPYDYYQNNECKKLYPELEDKVSFKELYKSQLTAMVSYIALTNIDWSEQYKEYCKNRNK